MARRSGRAVADDAHCRRSADGLIAWGRGSSGGEHFLSASHGDPVFHAFFFRGLERIGRPAARPAAGCVPHLLHPSLVSAGLRPFAAFRVLNKSDAKM